MGDSYKTCELHGKAFPQNLIDTDKVDVAKLIVKRQEEIEGENVTLSLMVSSKSETEGIDVCAQCLQDKVISLLESTPVWKNVSWAPVTMQKKDGSGTYTKNVKTVRNAEEMVAVIKEKKKATTK